MSDGINQVVMMPQLQQPLSQQQIYLPSHHPTSSGSVINQRHPSIGSGSIILLNGPPPTGNKFINNSINLPEDLSEDRELSV